MSLPDLAALQNAAEQVYQHMQPSPQLKWPLLAKRSGCDLWVKHENHNPTGAFKIRGGIVYMQRLKALQPECPGVVTATRGNHGQSVALAAAMVGMKAVVVVPEGNNPDKNRAMEALGAELIIHGKDFDEAVPYAGRIAEQRDLHPMPSFHTNLVEGVASYSLELLKAVPNLKRVYVPIGLGSGICGMVCARNALGLDTEIVGVVSDQADCYAQSLLAGTCVSTETANTFADGMAVRVPSPDALAIMQGNVARIVSVSDEEVRAAACHYFSDSHNVAEGAGAAPLAALLQEAPTSPDEPVAVVLSGGNIDAMLYREILKNA